MKNIRKHIVKIIIVFTLICIPSFVQFVWYPHILLWSIEDNLNFDAETNRQIKNLVYQVNISRYTFGFRDNSIFAEGVRANQARTFRNFIPQGILLSADRNYMQRLRELGDGRLALTIIFNNQHAGSSFFDTATPLAGGGMFGHYFQEFHFIRSPDGTYLIGDLEYHR